MSGCPPDPPPVEELESPEVLVPPAPGPTRLVRTPEQPKLRRTANRECDAVTALKRGLREYLEQVHLDVYGVRVRFERVLEVWAESDEVAVYPAAVVQARDEATYDSSSFTPQMDVVPLDGPVVDGVRTYLVKYSELTVPLCIEIHTSSPEERSQIGMLLEDALNPVDWMYGFKLDLPHYFGQRVVYEPVTAQQLDSEENARRRWRPGTVFLTGQISVVRSRVLPGLTPVVRVEVVEDVT